jgi:hypothetical protein
MARPLLFLFGLRATAQITYSASSTDGPWTDIYPYSQGFIMVNRNYGTAQCGNGTVDNCPETDAWNLGIEGKVYTAPSCTTVVLLDKEKEKATCFDMADPSMNCSDVDFRGATTVILGGNGTCTGVVWDKVEQEAECFGPFEDSCDAVDFKGVTDVYSNVGGGFVAFNSGTGSVQCFGDPASGGNCTQEDLLPAKPGLKLYQAHSAFLLYDPKERVGACWGNVDLGGDCDAVNFENVTGEIVGNKLGFVALEKDEGTAECWGDLTCPTSFEGVKKVVAGPSSFIAVEPIEGFCFPDACHDHGNLTFGLMEPILAVGPAFIGFGADGPICFGPMGAAHDAVKKACVALDIGDAKPSQVKVAGLDSQMYIVTYESLVPVDSELQIKNRQCFQTLPAEIDATGDVLDHVIVLYGGAYGTTGTYLQKSDTLFEKMDGTWSISWDGCKWELSRTTVVVDLECEDDVFAANALFSAAFLDDDERIKSSGYDEGICGAAAALGHCTQAVFAAVCSGTCGITLAGACTHDNDAAMAAYSKFNDMPTMKCAQAEELCEESAVVQAICKQTCGHKEFVLPTEQGKKYSVAEYNDKFFKERRMFRLEGRSLQVKRGGPSYLPTTAESMFVFMDSWDKKCTSTKDSVFAVDALTTTSLCELSTLGQLTDYTGVKTCPPSNAYATVSYAYCPWMNVDVLDPRVSSYKCSDTARDSNALCAPRETCEALCDSLGAECIGFDFVLGEDLCYLNRYQTVGTPGASYCSSNDIVAGTNGIEAPEGSFTGGRGYGHAKGMRYPDGHIPGARRLEHEELWSSPAMIFARKKVGEPFTPMYTTISKAYCRKNNTLIAPAAKTCEEVCDTANSTGDMETFKKFGCEKDFPDADNEVYCMVREECEATCTASADCVSFDMDRTLPRCWFNADCKDMVTDALYHDLVVKSPGPAPCIVEVTTPTVDSTGVAGVYTAISPTAYVNLDKKTDKFEYSTGCGWFLKRGKDALYKTWTGNCTGGEIDSFNFSKVYVNTCSGAPGMGATYFCEKYEPCQAYGFCLLSSERLGYELTAFRSWAFPKDAEPWKQPLCFAKDKENIEYAFEKYKPKAVADESRVEFVFDSLAFDGVEERPSPGTAHYLHMEIYRDVPTPPRVRLQSLSAAQRGVVTLVEPASDMLELGASYTVPPGYAAWVSDIMRFERMVRDGSPVPLSDKTVFSFELYLPTAGNFDDDFTLFKYDLATGGFVDVMTDKIPKKLGASIKPSTLTQEPGWVLIEIPDRFLTSIDDDDDEDACNVIDLIVAKDLNECKTPGICEENANCVNKKGGFDCICKEGWVSDGKGHCIASEAYASPLVVRVENDVELPWGWRIKEMELFSDDDCKVPLVSGVGEKYIWTKIEDRYCIGNQLAPKEVPGKSSTEVKDLEAFLCQGGKQADKAGLYDRPDKSGSNAYCMAASDCLAKCGEDPLCIGVDIHEYLPRCYFNYNIEGATTCAEQMMKDTLGDDHDFYFVFKDQSVVVQASSSFTDHWGTVHTPNNVIDGSMNSEWWSGLHNVGVLGAKVELLISGMATVGSARLVQSPRHAASRYRVSVGPRTGSLDVAGSKHVQGAEDGTFIEDRTLFTSTVVQTVENEVSPCMDLTCGDEGVRLLGDLLATFDGPKVPTPCHCKQLCLDHVDEGCRSYSFREGKDTNFDKYKAFGGGPCYPGGTGPCLGHTVCYLHTSAYTKETAKKHMEFTSGGVDLVLFSAELETDDDEDTIVVKAAGLPQLSSKQRVKVVFAGESCGAAPAPTVGSISCTDAYICHPKPTKVEKEKVSWAVAGKVAATKATQAYDVCYCAGPCFAASHWTKVPGGFSVEGTEGTSFTVSPAKPTRYVDFKLDVAGASKLDKVALASSQGRGLTHLEAACANATVMATHESTTVFNVSKLEDAGKPYGDYVVCIQVDGVGDFSPVPGASGPFLTIVPEFPTDATTVAGIYKDQQFSVMMGKKASIEILGSQLNTGGQAAIALTTEDSCSEAISEHHELEEANATANVTVWVVGNVGFEETTNSSDSATFEITVTADPGTYTICMCDGSATSTAMLNTSDFGVSTMCDSAAKYSVTVGKLAVTSRTDLGMTYVLEPGGEQSIEITGSKLKPWADRMTFVNCQDTCGVSKPSSLIGFPDGDYVGAFTSFEPVRDLSESPVDNCPYVNFTQNPFLVDTQFEKVTARYCVKTTVDLLELNAASASLVERHSCAEKCTKPCVGKHCNCEGNIGLDEAFVDDAICLPKYECEHLCMMLGDACHSVTVHETLPRCFLNGPACAGQVDADDPGVVASVIAAIEAAAESSSSGGKGGKGKNTQEYDPPPLRPLGLNLDYSLYIKVGSGAVPLDPEAAMDDEFESILWSASSRGDLVQGPGFSTQEVLRFAPLTLPSAGTYKVCFCDSEVSGECDDAEDFSIEVGKVHVSGLSCLLSIPKLQTAQCFEQYFGGLRCVPAK